ncbi:MAG: hypothetical protein JWO12_2679, partial [Frankiales bacterium]|nr:hypothetical protein [Frankiales bacterium]
LHAAESVPALEIISRDQGPEIDALRREIHALNNTRTMRALKPARNFYARVRARAR